mgnify:CR=1 FL=1
MPKTKEEKKEYAAQYYIKHRERLLKKQNDYDEIHKEERKEYKILNSEKIKEQRKLYESTTKGMKNVKILGWKSNGVKGDYDEIYDRYINTEICDNCGIELVEGNKLANRRCMDHCHTTGLFRNILCHSCNVRRGP